jgi:hypothetical protein
MLKRHRLRVTLLCIGLCAFAGAMLGGCASLHPSPNGPGNCVGPPDFCVPYFGT